MVLLIYVIIAHTVSLFYSVALIKHETSLETSCTLNNHVNNIQTCIKVHSTSDSQKSIFSYLPRAGQWKFISSEKLSLNFVILFLCYLPEGQCFMVLILHNLLSICRKPPGKFMAFRVCVCEESFSWQWMLQKIKYLLQHERHDSFFKRWTCIIIDASFYGRSAS